MGRIGGKQRNNLLLHIAFLARFVSILGNNLLQHKKLGENTCNTKTKTQRLKSVHHISHNHLTINQIKTPHRSIEITKQALNKPQKFSHK
jgi:hypothetical protein